MWEKPGRHVSDRVRLIIGTNLGLDMEAYSQTVNSLPQPF